MKLLSRSRGDLLLGAWALAPVVAIVVLIITWQQRLSHGTEYLGNVQSPIAPWMFFEMLGVIGLLAICAGVIVRDIWRRPLPTGLRKAWTVMAILGAPMGGLAYWLIHCHRSGAEPAVGEAA